MRGAGGGSGGRAGGRLPPALASGPTPSHLRLCSLAPHTFSTFKVDRIHFSSLPTPRVLSAPSHCNLPRVLHQCPPASPALHAAPERPVLKGDALTSHPLEWLNDNRETENKCRGGRGETGSTSCSGPCPWWVGTVSWGPGGGCRLHLTQKMQAVSPHWLLDPFSHSHFTAQSRSHSHTPSRQVRAASRPGGTRVGGQHRKPPC